MADGVVKMTRYNTEIYAHQDRMHQAEKAHLSSVHPRKQQLGQHNRRTFRPGIAGKSCFIVNAYGTCLCYQFVLLIYLPAARYGGSRTQQVAWAKSSTWRFLDCKPSRQQGFRVDCMLPVCQWGNSIKRVCQAEWGVLPVLSPVLFRDPTYAPMTENWLTRPITHAHNNAGYMEQMRRQTGAARFRVLPRTRRFGVLFHTD